MQKKDTLPVHKRNILLLTVDLLLESTWKPSGLCMPHTSFHPYGCGWRNSTPKPPLLHHAPCFAGNFLHQLVVPRPTHCSVLLERVCIPTGGRGEGPGNADKYTPFENLQKPYQSCKTYITTLEPFQKNPKPQTLNQHKTSPRRSPELQEEPSSPRGPEMEAAASAAASAEKGGLISLNRVWGFGVCFFVFSGGFGVSGLRFRVKSRP